MRKHLFFIGEKGTLDVNIGEKLLCTAAFAATLEMENSEGEINMITIGAFLGCFAVMLGAFGAHALKGKFAEERYEKTWETGTQYHMYHALALVALGILSNEALLGASAQLAWAGYCFIAGIVLFSGSLYVLAVTGIKKLGAITPIGGVFFLVGWVLLALAAM